ACSECDVSEFKLNPDLMRASRLIRWILGGRALQELVRSFESRPLLIRRGYDSQSQQRDAIVTHCSHIVGISFLKLASGFHHFGVRSAGSRLVSKIVVCGIA